jgi:hypothetical protein
MKKLVNLKKSIFGVVAINLFCLSSLIGYASSSVDKEKRITYYSSNQIEDEYDIKYEQGKNKYRVRVRGEITISKDDKDITAISEGGYLEIKKSSFGSSRKIVIELVRGKLHKKYYVGYSQKDFSPEGKNWLAEILPEIVRTSLIGAESRVDRFYKEGGASAVLGDLDSFDREHLKLAYINLLLEKNLKNNELILVLNGLGRYVESDHYIAKILMNNQKQFTSNAKILEVYLNAVNRINSDYCITTVLERAIKDESISDKTLAKIFDNIKLDSDYYLSEVLNQYIDYRTINKQNIDKVFELSTNMNSEYDRFELYKKLMKKSEFKEIGIDVFLPYFSKMNSDYCLINTLSFLIDNNLLNKQNMHDVLKLAAQIQSDDHKYIMGYDNVFDNQVVLEGEEFEDFFVPVKDFESNSGSDYYKAEILKNLIKNSDSLEISTDEILPFISDINSDNYLFGILNYVVDIMSLSEQNLDTIFNFSKNFRYDYYKLQLFNKVVSKISVNKKIVTTLFDYIKNEIKDDNYKIEVIKQIINKNQSDVDLTNETLELLGQFRYEENIYSLIILVNEQWKLSEKQLVKVLDSVREYVKSDYYLTEILIYFSKRVIKSSEKVKKAYLKCTKSINNEYYYGKALKAINKESQP